MSKKQKLKKAPKFSRSLALFFLCFAVIGGAYYVVNSFAASKKKATIAFYDDFNNMKLSGWEKFDEGVLSEKSEWKIAVPSNNPIQFNTGTLMSATGAWSGSKEETNDQQKTKPGSYIVNGNYGWKNYYGTARIMTEDDDAVGIVLRYKDTDNYTRFSMDREIGYRRVTQKIQGKTHVLWEEYFQGRNKSSSRRQGNSYETNKWYRVTFSLNGSKLKIKLFDESVDSKKDILNHKVITLLSETSGVFGFYSWGSKNAYFDDVVIRSEINDGFTLAVLPDTQYYTENPGEKEIFVSQTSWLASNRARSKIAFVLHEGDIVGQMCDRSQWQEGREAMSYLDGKVPYAFAPGNHDIIDYKNVCAKPGVISGDYINEYFSHANQTQTNKYTYKSGRKDSSGKYDTMNTYHMFSAGGVDFLVLSLQFAPDASVLEWARHIAEKYNDRYTILLTHDFLDVDGTLRGSKEAKVNNSSGCVATGSKSAKHFALPSTPETCDGNQIWQKLVNKDSVNIRLVMNGHVVDVRPGQSHSQNGATSRAELIKSNGTKVNAILANYQDMQAKGYLRLMEFKPDTGTINVKTYSPYLNQYLKDGKNQFSIPGGM